MGLHLSDLLEAKGLLGRSGLNPHPHGALMHGAQAFYHQHVQPITGPKSKKYTASSVSVLGV